MSIPSVDFIPANISLNQLAEGGAPKQAVSGEFGAWFDSQLNELNNQLSNSDMQLRKLAAGESNNIHEVMLSLEKAKLSFELVLQIRNKTLEAYQELMRMQI